MNCTVRRKLRRKNTEHLPQAHEPAPPTVGVKVKPFSGATKAIPPPLSGVSHR
jgi:hypothetical protein